MIRDRDRLVRSSAHALALDCLEAGIKAAQPDQAVRQALSLDGEILRVGEETFDLANFNRVLVLGAGKASPGVVRGLRDVFGDLLDDGVVAVPDDVDLGPVDAVVAGHPTPTAGSREAADRLLELADQADERTLVLAPITGGGSAHLAAPDERLSLNMLQEVTAALVASGASIAEINAVRKHCSTVKGGRLARRLIPATVVALLVSDVVGDDPAIIASGPLAPDPSTFEEALAVLERHGIKAPEVRGHLEAGVHGEYGETPKEGDDAFTRVSTHLLAGGRTAIDAAARLARQRDVTPLILSTRIRGESREAALTHVAIAEDALETGEPIEPPAVVLSGGETTVTVRGDGEGGPNLEFALAAAIEIPRGAVLMSVDSDGRDGSTDAAGALVTARTVDDRVGACGALDRNDTLPYLRDRGAVVETGETGTNVNDLRVLVLGV